MAFSKRFQSFLNELEEKEGMTRGSESSGASAELQTKETVKSSKAASFLKRLGLEEEYNSPVNAEDVQPFQQNVRQLGRDVRSATFPSQYKQNAQRHNQLTETGDQLEAYGNTKDIQTQIDVFRGNTALSNIWKNINAQADMANYDSDIDYVKDKTDSYEQYKKFVEASMGLDDRELTREIYTYGQEKKDEAPEGGYTIAAPDETRIDEIELILRRGYIDDPTKPLTDEEWDALAAEQEQLENANTAIVQEAEAEKKKAETSYFDRYKEDYQAQLDEYWAEADAKRLESFKLQQQAIESNDPAEAQRLRDEAARVNAEAQSMMNETQQKEDEAQAVYDSLEPDRNWGKYIGSGVMQGFSDFANAAYQTYDVILGKPIDAIVNGAKSAIEKVFNVDTGADFRNPLSKLADFHKGVNAKHHAEATEAARQMGGGEGWKVGQQVIGGLIQNVPNALMAFLTGGASAGVTGAQNAAVKAMNAVGNSKVVQTVQGMITNPQYWSSFAQTLGNDYNEALAESGDPVKAALYSIGVSLVNAGIEIGLEGDSGIQGLGKALAENDIPGFMRVLKAGGDEYTEEVKQGLVSGVAKKVIYDAEKPWISATDNNAIISPELKESATVGGLTGMLMGGGAEATNAAIGAYQDKKAQQEYAEAVRAFFDENAAVNTDTDGAGTNVSTAVNADEDGAGANTPAAENAPTTENTLPAADLTGEETAYQYGESGRSQEELQETLENSGITMTDKDRAAYTKGEKARQKKIIERRRYIDTLNRGGENGSRQGVFRSISEREIGMLQEKGVKVNAFSGKFSDKQRAASDALRKVAETMHLNMVYFESPTDSEGNRQGANGFYDSDSNTVYLDVFAGTGNEQAIMRAAAHELTHVIQNWAPEQYKKLQDTLTNYYYSTGKDTLRSMVQRQLDKANAAGVEMTEVQAMDEVTADACEMMFSDIDAMREIYNTDKTLFQKIGEWITKFVDSIKAAMQGVRESTDEAHLLMASRETWENARKVWYQALEEAGQNNPGYVDQNADFAENVQNDVIEKPESVIKEAPIVTKAVAEPETIDEYDDDDDGVENDYGGKTYYAEFETPVKKKSNKGVAYTADQTPIDFHYELVNAEDLIASNTTGFEVNEAYPQELQPRDRQRQASRDQVWNMARNLNPVRLGESVDVQNGAPIIGSDRVVESGNGRVLAVQLAMKYGEKSAGKYSKWLRENAATFGLDAGSVQDNSVLVRVRDSEVKRTQFVKDANESTTASYSESESAQSDSEKLTPEMLELFVPSETGRLDTRENHAFVSHFLDRVIPRNERASYVQQDGSISQRGWTRLRNAIFQRAYGSSQLTGALSEATEDGTKNVIRAMTNSAPKMVLTQESVKKQQLYDVKMPETMTEAARRYMQLKRDGMDVNVYLSQVKMPGLEEESAGAQALMRMFDKYKGSTNQLTQALNTVMDVLEEYGEPNQVSMFGERVAPELADIVSQAQQRMDSGRVQYSLRAFDDGTRFVDVQADQDKFDGLTETEMMNKARDIIKEKFQGKVVGIDNPAFVNGVGAREYARPAAFVREQETKEAKMRAAGELDNLLDAGVYYGREDDGRDGHTHKNTEGFTYYKTMFKVGEKYFEGIVNVANVNGRRLFKDVTKIKNITQDITSSYGGIPKSRFLRDVSMNSISEDNENVNGKVQFSMREPVETVGSLVAVHNLTEEKLRKTLDLGGFPMPSIAITTPEVGHANFGSISLVFGRETIDPGADRRNKVYSADAWTPTFPEIEYEADDKVVSNISKMYYRLAREHGYDAMRPLYNYVNDAERQLKNVNGEQGVIDRLRDDTEMMQIFLADAGKSMVQPVMREKVTRMSENEVSIAQDIIAEIGEDAIRGMAVPEGVPIITHRKQWFTQNEEGLRRVFEKRAIKNGSTEAEAKELSEYLDRRALMEMAQTARKYLNGASETRTQEEDREATKQAIRKAADGAAYEKWLQKTFGGIEKGTGIYNNKEYYTPSGNRRSFAQTHYPVTLENIVRAMAGQNGGNTKNVSGFHGIKTLRAGTAKRFASIADVHALEGRLKNLTEEQVEAINDQLSERLSKLMDQVLDLNPIGKNDNMFIRMDQIGEVMMEIAESKKYDAANVRKMFSKYGYKLNEEVAKGIEELLVDTEQMPVHIFEAKPERVASFDEVKAAILPGNISPEIRQQLEDMGVRTETYNEGDENQRKALLNSMPELRFSQRDTEYKTDRQLLASALESVTKDAEEAQMLRDYQEIAAKLDADERRVQEINERIRELRMENVNTPEEQLLMEERKGLEKGITSADRRLFQMERLKPLQRIAKIQRKEAEAALNRAKRHLERYKEGVTQREYVARIKKTSDKLSKWLTQPNNQRYVPEAMRKPLAEFLLAIDRGSETQLSGQGMTKADRDYARTVDKLKDVVESINKYQQGDEEYGADANMHFDLPHGFAEMMADTVKMLEAKQKALGDNLTLNRMTSQELEELYKVLVAINSSIIHANDFLSTANAKHVDEVAGKSIAYLNDQKERKVSLPGADYLTWTNTQPIYAFERFGEGGKEVFRMLQGGQSKLAFNTQKILDATKEIYTSKQVRRWQKEKKTFNINGKEISIPVTHIMSLYCISNRAQGQTHLYGDGIRVADTKKGPVTIAGAETRVSEADVQKIVSSLTAEQKKVADALQKTMSTVGAQWGNEVSMKRFGYRMFTEQHYFPLRTVAEGRPVKTDGETGNELYRLLNISSAKPIVKGAQNMILLDNIFDVYAAHMSDMAQYNALALPVLDAVKWLNYKETEEITGEDGETRNLFKDSVRSAARIAYGDAANKYIIRLLKDVNGAQMTGGEDAIGLKMIGRQNRAAVAGNMRVVMLQPLSIIRAGLVLGDMSVVKGIGLGAVRIRKNFREMEKYSGIAVWKDLGFYDVNISRGVKQMIKNDSSLTEKGVEFLMAPAGIADHVTWALMWEATKKKVAKTTPTTAENFMEKVAEKFEEVVYKTQVVDSVLTKSQFMRGKTFFPKMMSSFMSEPTTTYNMVMDAHYKLLQDMRSSKRKGLGKFQEAWQKNGNGKRLMHTMSIFTMSALVSTLVEQLFSAYRDEDDYETFWEKYKDGMLDSFVNNMVLVNKVPILKEVWEVGKTIAAAAGVDTFGYESETVIGSVASEIEKAVEIFAAKAAGNPTNYTKYGGTYKGLQALSDISGIPFAGVTREIVALYNAVIAPSTGRKIVAYQTGKSYGYEQLYEAIQTGNKERETTILAELHENGADDKEIESGLRKLAKEDWTAGNMTDKEAIEFLKKYDDMTEKEAYWKLEEWGWEGEDEDDKFSVYSELEDALLSGKGIDDAITKLTTHGYEKTDVQSRVRSIIKDAYLEGDLTKSKVETYLKKYGNVTTDNEVWFKLQQYEYERLTKESTSSDVCMVFYAIDNKQSPQSAIKEAISHGKTKEGIASSLTSHYKPQYLQLLKTNKSAAYQLATRLAGIFDYLGYKGTEKVQRWTETK